MMDNSKRKYSIASDSVIEDESNSMYFSFNNSTVTENSDDKTLEAEQLTIYDDFNKNNDSIGNDMSIISTVRKCTDHSKSMRNISTKNILNNSGIYSSSPTKYFSPRAICNNKKISDSLGVSLLRIKCLEKSENKENVNIEDTPRVKAINEINLQLEKLKINNENSDEKSLNKIFVSPKENILQKSIKIIIENNNVQENNSENGNQSKTQSTVLKKENANASNLLKDVPSRVSNKKSPIIPETITCNNVKLLDKNKTKNTEKKIYTEIMANSMESAKNKIEKRRTINAAYTFSMRKSIINRKSINIEENNIIKRQTKFSISKTTLNSPGILNKNIRRKTLINNNIRKPIGKTTLFSDYPKKTESKISDNNRQSCSSLVSGKSLPPILKVKAETKHSPKEFHVQSIYYKEKISHIKISEYKCKFCDKKFAISKALQTHLLQNCIKIPAHVKKKLLLNQQSSNISESTISTMKFSTIKPVSTLTSSGSNNRIQSEVGYMPPPSSTRVKKKIPHSGIYRTPTKLLSCGECKQSYNNVYDYTEHTLSHSQEEN